jgi:O-antigen/teichoic acid export membrane protein
VKIVKKVTNLKNNQGVMKYLQNTSWLLGEKILRMIVGLFVGVWVARYLGPEQFGALAYVGSFVGLFLAFSSLGLDGVVVRELVKYPDKLNELIGTSFVLKIVGALGAVLLLIFVTHFISVTDEAKVFIFIFSISMVFQAFNVIDLSFQSKVQSKYVTYANTVAFLLTSLIKVFLIITASPLIFFVIVTVLDSAFVAIGLVYFYKNNYGSIFHWRCKWAVAKKLLSYSWPLIFSGSVLMIQARIDQVMINNFLGSEAVGHYSVALRLIEVFGFLPMLLKSSLYPSIVNAKKVSVSLYQARLLNFYRLNFLIFLLVATPIFLFGEILVVSLYGAEYEAAGVLLVLMSTRLFFTNMGVARGCFILTEGLMKFSLITLVIGTITNVLLNYIWIPKYGASSAILATIISFLVTQFLIDFLYFRTRGNVLLQFKSIVTFYKLTYK